MIDQVTADAGGYPYFLQFIGREIINNAPKTRIKLDDYLRIQGTITARLDGDFYDQRMDALSHAQKRVLAAMSKIDGDDVTVSKIVRTTGIGKASLVQHFVRLEEKGMVHRHSYGTYRFSLPMLREYLRRRVGGTELA